MAQTSASCYNLDIEQVVVQRTDDTLVCTVWFDGKSAITSHYRTVRRTISWLYTVNHKKRDILFLTITLANLNRFLSFLYHFNREKILHATVIKFTTSP